MRFDEFRGRKSFSFGELLAFARGTLVSDAPFPMPLLPQSLIFPFHQVVRLEWDEDHQKGRIEAVRKNRIDDWFYGCHFLSDPVMPGCWGIDAIWQCLRFYAAWRGLAGCDKPVAMDDVSFFGQIRPYDQEVRYEVEVTKIERDGAECVISGKGAVKIDGVLIYTIGDAAVGTSYGEGVESVPLPVDLTSKPRPPFEQRLSRGAFHQCDAFNQAELIAFSRGSLVADPPVELGALPASLMLEPREINCITFDPGVGEGLLVATLRNGPLEWFHAMNDGLKPSALSVDAVWQLLGLFLFWRGSVGLGRALGFEALTIADSVRPEDESVVCIVRVRRMFEAPQTGDSFIRGDASIFADGRLILTCLNASVGCHRHIGYADYPLLGAKAHGGKLELKV